MSTDLDRITLAGRTPHGYTLAIWAAGMFCISRQGLPSMLSVLLFTLGATAAFGLLRVVVANCRSRTDAKVATTQPTGGSVHVVALPGAVLVSWLLASLPTPWCWLATSSAATVVFIVLHGGQDALLRRWQARARHHRIGSSPGSSASRSAPLSS